MSRIKKFISDIPLSVINIISVISGLLTIISFIATAVSAVLFKPTYLKYSGICFCVFTIIFGYLYWNKLIKYRQIAKARLVVHSQEMSIVNQEVANAIFDILHFHKARQLTTILLDTKVKTSLTSLLDSIVRIMELDTGQEINACIKLIQPSEIEITLDNARICTFVRSTKGGLMRSAYDVEHPKPVLVKDNTDFLQIFTKKASYFYEGNLIKYSEKLAEVREHYLNTHTDWKDCYRGTIVVPIRIQHKFLHFTKQDEDYQIIGFLCVDSMSTEAFLERQKKENIAFLEAYASLIYILLNKYQHYLGKLTAQSLGGESQNA